MVALETHLVSCEWLFRCIGRLGALMDKHLINNKKILPFRPNNTCWVHPCQPKIALALAKYSLGCRCCMVFYLLSLQVFNICDFRAWFPWERNHQTSTSNHPIGRFFTAPREIPKSPVASPSAKRGTPPLHIHNLGIRRANWARREEARSRTAANGSDNMSLDCFRKIERSGKQSSMSRKQTISAIELTGISGFAILKPPLKQHKNR